VAEPAMAEHPTSVPFHPEVFTTDAQGRWQLGGTRCRRCGAHFFPRRAICAKCLSSDTETVPLSTRGVLYTFTVVHQSTPEFTTPYLLGYGDLPEGVRVLAPLAEISADRVRIGMAVELQIEPVGTDSQGRTIMGYRWHAGEVSRE